MTSSNSKKNIKVKVYLLTQDRTFEKYKFASKDKLTSILRNTNMAPNSTKSHEFLHVFHLLCSC